MDGFDTNSHLACEGIIGDGCGGGRIFYIEDETLFAFYPQTNEKTLLLNNVIDAKEISKKGCVISILCVDVEIKFDLSALKKV